MYACWGAEDFGSYAWEVESDRKATSFRNVVGVGDLRVRRWRNLWHIFGCVRMWIVENRDGACIRDTNKRFAVDLECGAVRYILDGGGGRRMWTAARGGLHSTSSASDPPEQRMHQAGRSDRGNHAVVGSSDAGVGVYCLRRLLWRIPVEGRFSTHTRGTSTVSMVPFHIREAVEGPGL